MHACAFAGDVNEELAQLTGIGAYVTDLTAIFVWIDGFSFSALIGSRILAKSRGFLLRAARILRRIFLFGWDFY